MDNKRHTKETIEKVISLKDKKTKVLICPYDFVPNFAYYYNPTIFKETDKRKPYQLMAERLSVEDIYAVYSINDVQIHDSDRVIFLDAASAFSYPENNILKTLEKSHTIKTPIHFMKYLRCMNSKKRFDQ